MGDAIVKAHLVKGLKRSGDRVIKNDSFFEISTDNIECQIAAPTTGTLVRILAPKGVRVSINWVVCTIDNGLCSPGTAGLR